MKPASPVLRVLIVDDSDDVRCVLSELLADRDFEVLEAATAEQAMKIIDEDVFDTVLLDVHLPDKGGQEVLAHIRRLPHTASIPVLLITGSREAEYDIIDVFDYLPKPVDFNRLYEDLEYIAARKRLEGDLGAGTAGLPDEGLSDSDFDAFRFLLQKRCGLDIPRRRKADVDKAVWARMRALLKPSVDSYRRLIDSPRGEDELKKFALLLTVGETYFFRNNSHFTVLTDSVLPDLKERLGAQGRKRVRVLSSGCSTGEEAYSLAIALDEVFPAVAGWDVRIFAIDINNRSLNLGRRGVYRGSSFRAVDEELKKRYFDPLDGGLWRIKRHLRDLVDFRYFNLSSLARGDVPSWLRRMDIVFCRNVLIYFDSDTIDRVIRTFGDIIPPDGFLFLGHSESFLQSSRYFQTRYADDVFYYARRSSDTPARMPDASLQSPSGAEKDEYGDLVCDFEHEFQRGLELLDKEAFDEAGKVFERMLRLRPNHPRAFVGTGFILANRGQEKKALELIDKALRSDPGIAEAYFLRALLLERRNKVQQAFEDYQRAVLWDPSFVMARLNLGFAAERMGKRDSARQTFAEAYRLINGETSCKADVKLSGGLSREALKALARGKAV